MKLEIGKTYKDGWGDIHTIAGYTRRRKQWVWSLRGNWYRESDGRFISYTGERHAPLDFETRYDLVEEVEDYA